MNIWKKDLRPCDLDNGEYIIIILKDKTLHVVSEHHEWYYNGSDEVCHTTLKIVDDYDCYELDEVERWCYLDDLYKIFPPDLAFDGSPDFGYVITYKRLGNTEHRIFYNRESAADFFKSVRYIPGYEFGEHPISSYYMDKCED